jgi:GH25 family lysozyme M1 (1,4-beta-N-acetylmuramidase)
MRRLSGISAMLLAFMVLPSISYGQDQPQGPADLDAMRRLRLLEAEENRARAAPTTTAVPPTSVWTLTPEAAKTSKGTFGIDLSHYETNNCVIKWSAVAAGGLRYVYLEVTEGKSSYASVIGNWKELAPLHAAKTLLRGAYHFLLPTEGLDTNASSQAENFLATIGATEGNKPIGLPPMLDIEPTHTPVTPGTAEYDKCQRRTKDGSSYYCDMWYKMKNQQDIATLALNWVNAVKEATGQDVIIYSSPGAWAQVIGTTGRQLLEGRAIWIARYPSDGGPDKDSRWPTGSWNATWNMPTLFGGASYPSAVYNVPDLWQFSETGRLEENPITCHGQSDPFAGQLDLNYIPVRDALFETVFGIH